jgi:hypothetical protein
MMPQMFPFSPDQVVDPLFLRTYAETQSKQKRQQVALEQAIKQFLDLGPQDEVDWTAIPPAAEIRQRMSQSIPADESLSDLIVVMREG